MTAATRLSLGINAQTGASISGWDHVVQSLQDIFLTRFGSRFMREWYGSFVPTALGRNITRDELLPVIASITSAIEQFEPRYRILSTVLGGTLRDGRMTITLVGSYRPRALLGDFTEEGSKTLAVALSRDALSLEV